MQTILHNCCGLDVHKDSVVACILKTREPLMVERQREDVEKEIRVFETFPNDLARLREWLESESCCHVAMESTGVYWFPIYDALETACDGKMEIIVANARHMKNVPGKKTDIKDSEWIAKLLRAGLLAGSFIPPQDVRELRQLTRYRKNVVEDAGTQKNRIEKTLQQAGFKLSTFLSDIFGISGRNLMRVLLDKGSLSASDVENETKRISSAKKDDIKRAISGQLSLQQRGFLKLQLNHLDELSKHLSTIEQSILTLSVKFKTEIDLLDTIPGIAQTSATAVIAEIGIDMSKFPTAQHFCSWAGVVPGDNKSAGKRKSTRISFGNTYIKGLICECAWAAVRVRDSYLSRFYWKIKQRRGAKKAIIALARKILVIIYHLLKNHHVYDEVKFESAKIKQEAFRLKKLAADAKKLGFNLTPAA
jgi:transposase